ncbi:IS110 family transposase, partial [Leptospira santarosai]|nr:IS110 family transposase [Leptospira santarosai]
MQALHSHKTRKPTEGTKVKRKVYVGMDVHKETIQLASLTSNANE